MEWRSLKWHLILWWGMACNEMTWHGMQRFIQVKQTVISFCHDMNCHNMTGHDMIWHDMTWHDMLWHVIKWHDMSWYQSANFKHFFKLLQTVNIFQKIKTFLHHSNILILFVLFNKPWLCLPLFTHLCLFSNKSKQQIHKDEFFVNKQMKKYLRMITNFHEIHLFVIRCFSFQW